MTDYEFFWLVGLLEGEGSFSARPPSAPNLVRISLHMTDVDIVAKVAQLWGQSYHQVQKARSEKMGWKPSFQVLLRGKAAVDLMKRMQPHMGQRRQEQTRRALDSYNPNLQHKLSQTHLEEIRSKLQQGQRQTDIAAQYGVDR